MKGQIKEMLELEYKLASKNINYRRLVYLGVAKSIEIILTKLDYENFKVELVDIWHFLMSYLLTQNTIDECITFIYQNMDVTPVKEKLPNELTAENNLKIDDILLPYEELMAYALLKTDSEEYQKEFVKRFFVCLNSASMSFTDLYTLYIGKNVLNKFRQDHGYKDGTYKKIWANGQEDNVSMQYILKQNPDFGFDELYAELEKEYQK
ncbi:MAG: dUTP diphosphatase [Candidatus Gracilibacteria bacterium]|nr:dUTP diphosphatase [Candidatus Gracilibacteria bacterium]